MLDASVVSWPRSSTYSPTSTNQRGRHPAAWTVAGSPESCTALPWASSPSSRERCTPSLAGPAGLCNACPPFEMRWKQSYLLEDQK